MKAMGKRKGKRKITDLKRKQGIPQEIQVKNHKNHNNRVDNFLPSGTTKLLLRTKKIFIRVSSFP